jgi:Flp pilus assembly pilin Flp
MEGSAMLRNTLKRLVVEDQGMEMVEWAIVGVVFALAAAVVWTSLKDSIGVALGNIGSTVENPPG